MIPIIEFVLGIGLLVYSAEKLIGYLTFGVVLNFQDLSNVALGTVSGPTVALTGVVLALAAIIAPCPVDVPKDYLVLFVAAPVVMFVLAFTKSLTLVTGRVPTRRGFSPILDDVRSGRMRCWRAKFYFPVVQILPVSNLPFAIMTGFADAVIERSFAGFYSRLCD